MSQAPPKVYNNVKFRGQSGKIRLTEEKIAFRPNDWATEDGGVYDSWRWTAVLKHQVNNKNAKKALLKLISKADANKCVIFQMKDHNQLDRIRNDVTDRMRQAKRKAAMIRRESTRSSKGMFFGLRDSLSVASFHSEKSDKSSSADPSQSCSDCGEMPLMPDISRCGTLKTSNLQRHRLMLDPRTDLAPPASRTFVVTPDFQKFKTFATKKAPPKARAKRTPRKQTAIIRQIAIALSLGALVVVIFNKAASLGYLNGVTDNTPLKERILPRFFQKQPKPKLTLDDMDFCLWENKSSVVGENDCKVTLPIQMFL